MIPPTEAVQATIRDPAASTNVYGPGFSPTPFRSSPTATDMDASVAPGVAKYMRYRLSNATVGTLYAATFVLFVGNDQSSPSTTRTMGFTLS